jgi:hypothetical protein
LKYCLCCLIFQRWLELGGHPNYSPCFPL